MQNIHTVGVINALQSLVRNYHSRSLQVQRFISQTDQPGPDLMSVIEGKEVEALKEHWVVVAGECRPEARCRRATRSYVYPHRSSSASSASFPGLCIDVVDGNSGGSFCGSPQLIEH
jgi:hypothetical protein